MRSVDLSPLFARISPAPDSARNEVVSGWGSSTVTPPDARGLWKAPCPTGRHETPKADEVSWSDGDKKILGLRCLKGCTRAQVLAALGLSEDDTWLDATNLPQVSRELGLPVDYLVSLGLEQEGPFVKVPYMNLDGSPARRYQIRRSRSAATRFTWDRAGAKTGDTLAYGLDRLALAQAEMNVGDPYTDPYLFIVEGPSDCWSAWRHDVPCLGLPGATTTKLLLPEYLVDIRAVYLVREPGEAGEAFVSGCVKRLTEIGFAGQVYDTPMLDGYKDLNVVLAQYPDREPFRSECDRARVNARLVDLERPAEADTSGRPQVEITRDRFKDKRLMTTALIERNTPPVLFLYGDALARLVPELSRVEMLSTDSLHDRLVDSVHWVTIPDGGTGPRPANLDPVLLRMMLLDSAAHARMPKLRRIVKSPVFSPEGLLVQRPGYDAQSGIYLMPSDLRVPDVSLAPTADEVDEAKALLLDTLLVDFPFQDPGADRATAIAFAVLPFVRDMIQGPTPLHVFNAPMPGSGKSLIVEVLSQIAIGGGGAVGMTEADNEEETRKRLTAKLLEEPTFLFLENLNAQLQGASVAQMLTATTWSDRILGVSKMANLPVRCVWVACANQPTFSTEVADRVVSCRITPKVSRPRDRDVTKFKVALPGWARANRGRLVWACLTLVQTWIAAGQPRGTAVLGSFQDWAEIMSGILETVGIPGLLTNRQRVLARTDPAQQARENFVETWMAESGLVTVYASALVPFAAAVGLGNITDRRKPDGAVERSESIRMGKTLEKLEGTVFDLVDGRSVTIERGDPPQDRLGSKWRLVPVEPEPEPTDPFMEVR